MRPTLLLLAASLLSLPVAARAQELGVKAGVNLATLGDAQEAFPDDSPYAGAVAGAWIRLGTGTRVSFQVEGLFAEKGIRFDLRDFDVVATGFLRMRYLEMPLLARADFGDTTAPARLFVVGGVAPALRLSAQAGLDTGDNEVSNDAEDDTEAYDLGVTAGIGATVGRFVVEARYTHGLRRINIDQDDDEQHNNRVLSLTAGLRLWR